MQHLSTLITQHGSENPAEIYSEYLILTFFIFSYSTLLPLQQNLDWVQYRYNLMELITRHQSCSHQ